MSVTLLGTTASKSNRGGREARTYPAASEPSTGSTVFTGELEAAQGNGTWRLVGALDVVAHLLPHSPVVVDVLGV